MIKNKSVIVSRYIPDECINMLKSMGYNAFMGAVLPHVDKAVAHHIDMQLVKCSESTFLCAPCVYEHYLPAFVNTSFELKKGIKDPHGSYPNDIGYNVATTGKYAIHNVLHTDKAFFDLSSHTDISVRQGYSKCNTCVVSDDAIITSDRGIADILSKYPIDVLLIREGYIKLNGYNHGFIGGCSGLLEKNLLAFAGNISSHPDHDSIRSFCANHGVETVSLYDGDLVDIGTIVSVG